MRTPAFTAADARHETELAGVRVAGHVRETPCEASPALGAGDGGVAFLKMENLQVTSSFKARGAVNKVLSLSADELEAGLVTASVGNHALAMIYAMGLVGAQGEIWVSGRISAVKMAALEACGARLQRVAGDDPAGVEALARESAETSGRVYVSPYNDPQIIGGQGTVAVELLRQVEDLDAVFVPVGGGGLISGIGAYVKEIDPQIRVVGCQAANSPVMAASLAAGGELLATPWAPSLADGVVGLVEPGAVTYSLCRECVDEWVLASEPEIAAALQFVMREHHVLIEGAAALPVAGYLQARERWAGKRVACVLSGARIGLETLTEVLCGSFRP